MRAWVEGHRHARLIACIRRQLESGAGHLTLSSRQVALLRSLAPPGARRHIDVGRLGWITGYPIVVKRPWWSRR